MGAWLLNLQSSTILSPCCTSAYGDCCTSSAVPPVLSSFRGQNTILIQLLLSYLCQPSTIQCSPRSLLIHRIDVFLVFVSDEGSFQFECWREFLSTDRKIQRQDLEFLNFARVAWHNLLICIHRLQRIFAIFEDVRILDRFFNRLRIADLLHHSQELVRPWFQPSGAFELQGTH